jgi:hypothetical protein
VSGAATAAGYAEVWNPPEASGHVAGQTKTKVGAVTVKSDAGFKKESKATSKAASKHAVAVAAHGNQPAAHAGVNKVAAKGATKSGVSATHASKTGSKAAVAAQGKKPHAQLVQSKAGQGKVVRANLVVPARQAHPQTAKVAAKTGAAKPAASHVNVPASSANVSANPANATSNPATASSGSLPPILH